MTKLYINKKDLIHNLLNSKEKKGYITFHKKYNLNILLDYLPKDLVNEVCKYVNEKIKVNYDIVIYHVGNEIDITFECFEQPVFRFVLNIIFEHNNHYPLKLRLLMLERNNTLIERHSRTVDDFDYASPNNCILFFNYYMKEMYSKNQYINYIDDNYTHTKYKNQYITLQLCLAKGNNKYDEDDELDEEFYHIIGHVIREIKNHKELKCIIIMFKLIIDRIQKEFTKKLKKKIL
jgi:hypothetical protein